MHKTRKTRNFDRLSSFGVFWSRVAYEVSQVPPGGNVWQFVQQYVPGKDGDIDADKRALQELGYLTYVDQDTLYAARAKGERYTGREFSVNLKQRERMSKPPRRRK